MTPRYNPTRRREATTGTALQAPLEMDIRSDSESAFRLQASLLNQLESAFSSSGQGTLVPPPPGSTAALPSTADAKAARP